MERPDTIDSESIEHLVAQQVALPRSERRSRGAEGGLELAADLLSIDSDQSFAIELHFRRADIT